MKNAVMATDKRARASDCLAMVVAVAASGRGNKHRLGCELVPWGGTVVAILWPLPPWGGLVDLCVSDDEPRTCAMCSWNAKAGSYICNMFPSSTKDKKCPGIRSEIFQPFPASPWCPRLQTCGRVSPPATAAGLEAAVS